MGERDSNHWLWRLAATEWLEAAGRELELGEAASGNRRTAVTHARRAAGMAINAVLVEMAARGWSPGRSEGIWGRSYLDHLRSLADPGLEAPLRVPFDGEFSRLCRELIAIPVMPTGLVRIGRGPDDAAAAANALAGTMVEVCKAVVRTQEDRLP